ncbi:unnamed protein product [Schistosoma turkestanicum]|nr:unnamed protein product [Schistosoma turkestanicum]
MSRFSQLAAASDLQEQLWDLKLNSEIQSVDKNKCSNSVKKSKKKSRTSSKCSTESVRSHHSNIVLQDNADKINYDGLYIEPCGFRNVRNSCFLNASLQLLLNIPALCSTLYKFRGICISSSESVLNVSSTQEKKAPLTDQLLELIGKLNPQVVKHKTIVNNTSQYCNGYNNNNNNNVNTDNIVNNESKTKVDGNSNDPIPSTYKLSQPNGIQPFVLKHLITPDPVFRQLLHMNTGFQEDAAECLTYLLTQLHEEMGCMVSDKNTDVHNMGEIDQSQNDSEWIVTGRAGKHYPEARKIELDGGQSPIASLFCGTLVTRFNLGKSDNNYNTYNYSSMHNHAKKSAIKEPFFILHVPIDNPMVNSVESALRCLAELEEITDYHNSSDSFMSSVRRRSTVDRLPPYLMIQLKRFYNESKIKTVQNINTSVNQLNSSVTSKTSSVIIRKHLKSVNIQSKLVIPKELLSQETHFSNTERHYQLQAVIFHVGETVESGHYTIAVRINHSLEKSKNPTIPMFMYFDDDHACLLNNPESINLLLTTHRPLDTRNGTFLLLKKHVPSSSSTSSSSLSPSLSSHQQHNALLTTNIVNHPRTPYILLYASQLTVYS